MRDSVSYLFGLWYNSGAMVDVLQLLIEERERLNEAIAVLGGPRRRGRRPGDGKGASAGPKKAAKKKRRRPPMTAEQREAASERMKKIWAKRRKAKK